MQRNLRLSFVFFTVLSLFIAAPGFADEIGDAIKSAQKNYDKGDLSEAIKELNYAITLIEQKKGDALSKVFPPAPKGWTAEDVASGSMVGGGVQADRHYAKGDSQMDISISSDSPLMQGVMMMMANPMFATSGGGKLETIAGQKSVVNYRKEEKSGEIQFVVNNRFLVEVKGDNVALDEMKNLAKEIRFKEFDAVK